jgi:hypothetical protein
MITSKNHLRVIEEEVVHEDKEAEEVVAQEAKHQMLEVQHKVVEVELVIHLELHPIKKLIEVEEEEPPTRILNREVELKEVEKVKKEDNFMIKVTKVKN